MTQGTAMTQRTHSAWWEIEDVLAILDGSGITITDDKLVTRTLHKHGLMRSTPVRRDVPGCRNHQRRTLLSDIDDEPLTGSTRRWP